MKYKIFARLCSLVGALFIALSVTGCVKEPSKPNWDFIYIVDNVREVKLGSAPTTIDVQHVGLSVALSECTFVNENEQIALVNEKYQVVPVAVGTTKITITYKGLSSVLTVKVVE